MQIPHPIPYQGSKRNIAKCILKFFPEDTQLLVEPFAGSAALSIAAAHNCLSKKFLLNDINKPLMDLLSLIINNPEKISNEYRRLWNEQLGDEKAFYNKVRDEFNKSKQPELFLFLLARGVKASIRYNSNGFFNQSPDNRRKGKSPSNMQRDLFAVSKLLKGKVTIKSTDYREILHHVAKSDLIYMDPPYQGVCSPRDPRYIYGIKYADFLDEIRSLVEKDSLFIISYDGKKGNDSYGEYLPKELNLTHIEIDAGRSSQSTLLGGTDITYESLYLSPSVVDSLKVPINQLLGDKMKIQSI
jgi:DNA adenine methylase